MQRGSRTLFNDIFIESPSVIADGSGRNSELHERRNECMIDRYWFIGHSTGWSYPVVLKAVATEFFLTERRVYDVLQNDREMLLNVRAIKPSREQLEKKWPHLNWSTPARENYL
ncbi:MAG: hypothetical protein J0M30_14760 [Chitinophagales bacterium]|nr:hypothetical protein [Chitinophagales bacterium]